MILPFRVRRNIFHPMLVAVKQQSRASPWRTRLAWLLLGLTVLWAIVGLPLMPAFHDWLIAFYDLPYSTGVSLLFAALDTLSSLALALLGILIVFAQPGNRIGWLLSSFVLIISLVGLCEKYSVYAYVIYPEHALPLRELALWIQNWTWIPGVALPTIALPLLFPNGCLPSRQWRWFARWAIGVTSSLSFLIAFHSDAPIANYFLDIEHDLSNPYGIAALPPALAEVINPLWGLSLLTMLVAWLSLVVRYRQSDTITRQQIKWFVFGLGIVIMLFVVRNFSAYDPDSLLEIAFLLSINVLPITLGISILKYRLYDIDIIINRTLVYGSLTALVVGIYILVVGMLGTLFQSGGTLLISLVATGIVAVLFQPLRSRLQHAVNRLMFGERDDPVAVLSRLGQQLEATLTPEALLPGIVEMVAQTLKLPCAAIEVRKDKGFETAAAYGTPASEAVRFPLVYQAEIIGQLVVAPRARGDAFSPGERQLLENIAYQAGAAVHMVRLTADLQRSREHLVVAREEERRRLRRDLHDGLGPALATLSLQAEAARDLVHTDPHKSAALMNEVIAGTQAAIVNIRQVVYALRPPALDDLGLVMAISEHAAQYNENGLCITVEAPEQLPALPAAIEVAVYRIVQEALTNVVRHAEAQICAVRLTINGGIGLEICDDGQGIPKTRRAGVGLNSMHERAAELGGQCRIASTPGKGTQVHVTLPTRLGGKP